MTVTERTERASAVDRPVSGPVVWRPSAARRLAHATLLFPRTVLAARRRRAPYDPNPEKRAGQHLLERLDRLAPGAVEECRLVTVPCDQPPFHDSGIGLEEGDVVSTFAWGRAWLSKPLDVWIGADFQLWFRIAEGPVFRGVRATNTLRAQQSGPLRLGAYFPATWADRTGRLATSPRDYAKAAGAISVIVVKWGPGVDPRSVLAELARGEEHVELAAAEVDRLDNQVLAPRGWRYKWQLGDDEIFSDDPEADPHGGIRCHTNRDVACIARDIEMPLNAATRLRWRWRFDRLPSRLAEDSVLTHDYMSIAVEFDNGQDITYYWSASLPPGYAYPCPLPYWKYVETHIVLRSGTQQLGRWLSEERAVQEDYRRAVGPPPRRIVAVWLIGNSVFQRGDGSCQYADIELSDGERAVRLSTTRTPERDHMGPGSPAGHFPG